jgi:hypothetical protein
LGAFWWLSKPAMSQAVLAQAGHMHILSLRGLDSLEDRVNNSLVVLTHTLGVQVGTLGVVMVVSTAPVTPRGPISFWR